MEPAGLRYARDCGERLVAGKNALPPDRVVRSCMRWAGGIAAAFAVTAASCIDLSSHSCPAVAFVCDETNITLQSPNDAWTAGAYALAMVVDGVPQQCTIQVPDPPATAQGTCSANGTTLSLDPICPPVPIVCNDAGACGGMNSSEAIADCFPDRFTMGLTIGTGFGFMVSDAQPHVVGQLGLNLSVDGNPLMNETIAPKATTTGSAACGTCTNAASTLSIADD